MRNRRDPTWQFTSGKDRAYKAGPLKSRGVGKAFEGLIVPAKAGDNGWREAALL
jgi:hypothetical protein